MRYLKLSNQILIPLATQLPINDTYQFVFAQSDEEFVTTTLPLIKTPANMVDLEVLLADKKTAAIKDIHGYTVYTGYSSTIKDDETLITITMCREVKDVEKRLATAEDQLANKMPQIVEFANQALENSKTTLESASQAVLNSATAVTEAKEAVKNCDAYVEKVKTLEQQINPTYDFESMSLEEAKEYKWNEVNQKCQEAIYSGMDVTYNEETKHYSLTESDQSNLITYNTKILSAIAMSGITEPTQLTEYLETIKFLYHADGESCREYTANEINVIALAAEKHKTYHTTLVNKLHAWITREAIKDTILGITYDFDAMPSDLQEEMTQLFASVTDDTKTLLI